tara:strand:- start:618 stop:1055 length:438 start_codon:yes stop_codon:yes gene_type:complete
MEFKSIRLEKAILNSLISTLMLIFYPVCLEGVTKSYISSLEWEKRIVLFNIREKDNTVFERIESWINANKCQIEERNIAIIPFINGENHQYFFPIHLRSTGVWLIGYDGEVKAYSKSFELLEQITNLIDLMPIRKIEMQQNKSEC